MHFLSPPLIFCSFYSYLGATQTGFTKDKFATRMEEKEAKLADLVSLVQLRFALPYGHRQGSCGMACSCVFNFQACS